MPTPQPTELHHGQNARFQSGNRVYKVVMLGQGGVGKSGALCKAAINGCPVVCVRVATSC